MTVSTTYTPLSYAGNASTTQFPASWPFFTGSLVVTSVDATGVETVKALTTDYTVTGGTGATGIPATGSVMMVTAPATGTTLRITRVTPRTQSSAWGSNDAFPEEVVEAALDRLTMIGQEDTTAANTGISGEPLLFNTTGATDYWDGKSRILRSLADPTAATDAVTKGYADTTYGSAAGSATAAAASATAASASATAAAASAAASSLVTGFRWTFDSATAMAAPGTAKIRLNNATLSLVTALAVSDFTVDTGNPDVSISVLTWANSTNLNNRGTVTFRKSSAPQNFAEYSVNAALTDNVLWSQIPLAFVTSSGSFVNGDTINVIFSRTGDKGAAGAGTGDLLAANNLSDVASVATARSNLGLAIGTNVAAAGANTDLTSVYLNNTGLKIKDTNASHGLILAPGSDITADRTLTITTGDASRILNITGDATLPAGTAAIIGQNLSDLSTKYTAFDNLSIHGADIASAATINLEAATGNVVDVTGAVTCTAITLSDGHERTVRTTGIMVFTNGASLVLPGGANVTSAAGDYYTFRGYAAGVVRCTAIELASGRPLKVDTGDITTGTLGVARGGTGIVSATAYAVLVGGTTSTNPFQSIAGVGTTGQILTSNGAGAAPTFQTSTAGSTYTLLGTLTTTSGTTQSLTGFASSKCLICVIAGVSSNGANALFVAVSSNSGSSYGAAKNITVLQTAADFANGHVFIFQTAVTATKIISPAMASDTAGAYFGVSTDAITTGVTNAIQFSFNGNTFDAGAIYVFGVN